MRICNGTLSFGTPRILGVLDIDSCGDAINGTVVISGSATAIALDGAM